MKFLRSPICTIFLAVGLIGSLVTFVFGLTYFNLPGNQQGYEPNQPIAYSHRLHAGELKISCLYCHFGAEKSRHAGIPAASVCMNCHKFVTSTFGALRAEDALAQKEKRPMKRIVSTELQKLYDALGLDAKMLPDPKKTPQPIKWERVHQLPDYVFFDHRPHVFAGVTCQSCHGPVESMERMRQNENLSMGWCVNCHRNANQQGVAGKRVNANIDCSACHF